MHVRLVAVGDRQPSWVDAAFDDYAARLPRSWKFEIETVATGRRSKSEAKAVARNADGERILAKLKAAEHVVALDENGRGWTSRELAQALEKWQSTGANIAFVIGGPDGLADAVRERANEQWSLSPLTLPHGLARVLFAEQIYRAWSQSVGHPYHRD